MIADTLNNCLTILPMLDNLTALSPHVAVRFCSRKNHKMPLACLILRLRYSMQKIIYGGRYLGRESVQDSCVLSANPNNVHRPIFCRIKRCPLILTRVHTMPQNKSPQQNIPHAQIEQHQTNPCAAKE
jgi:hypothetical protein